MWKLKEIRREVNADSNPLINRLLSQRDVGDDDVFLNKRTADMPDSFSLYGVEHACNIFKEILEKKGTITIIGDYDADGVVSTTMLIEICRNFNLNYNFFIPSRLDHGYGLNPKTVSHFKSNYSPTDLLIIADCGSNNYNEIQELRDFGFGKIIIIDHHIMGDNISKNADALVSWHLSENKYEMCSTGEIFQFIRGLKKIGLEINPVEFLTYAAIGTIADVSPVIGANRIIVDKGLSGYAISHIVSSGLATLFNKVGLKSDNITPDDIGFKIAPRINAVGRLDDPKIVVHLLIESDNGLAEKIADYICKFNEDRKTVQKDIEEKISYYIENGDYSHGILIYDEDWHIGVVGIVASKVVEKYGKPALVIGNYNGVYKGSGRTVGGVNLKKILDTCSHIFSNYGGHAGAVGVTIKEEYIKEAGKIFNDACKNYFQEYGISGDIIDYYDATLKIDTISQITAQSLLDKMSPYCKDYNPEPIFKVSDVIIAKVEYKNNPKWNLIKFKIFRDNKLLDFYFSAWNSEWDESIEGSRANIYFKFPQSWGHGKYDDFQLKIQDIEIIN